jgi:preprotein translocase subunit SecF
MDWMKYRKIYFALSAIILVAGIVSMIIWGFKIGVDFAGGTVSEYRFENDISTEGVSNALDEKEVNVFSIQETSDKTYIFRLAAIDEEEKKKFEETVDEFSEGKADQLRFESVGPSIGPELVKKTIYALLISSVGILLWIAYQFKSIKFGLSAVLAMLHDSLVVLGVYSIFSHFFNAELDFLFASALLTVLSFSVHDTIVVYDRIRELSKKHGGNISELANAAVTETMVRSFNNSVTIIFMLIALVLLGGSTVRWFAVALLIGTISGTYSSPFVAVPLLVVWDDLATRFKLRK